MNHRAARLFAFCEVEIFAVDAGSSRTVILSTIQVVESELDSISSRISSASSSADEKLSSEERIRVTSAILPETDTQPDDASLAIYVFPEIPGFRVTMSYGMPEDGASGRHSKSFQGYACLGKTSCRVEFNHPAVKRITFTRPFGM